MVEVGWLEGWKFAICEFAGLKGLGLIGGIVWISVDFCVCAWVGEELLISSYLEERFWPWGSEGVVGSVMRGD